MVFQVLERDGWSIDCPYCKGKIIYTIIKNQQTPVPFFYSERANDVLLRKQDEERVDKLYSSLRGETPSLDALEVLWKSILKSSPEAPHGGRFGLWSYVKCPHCGTELPYNKGVRDLNIRIFEPDIILIDKAILLGNDLPNSWQIKVKLARE